MSPSGLIQGRWIDAHGKPGVTAAVSLRPGAEFLPIPFLIDTGASNSTISYNDAIAYLGIADEVLDNIHSVCRPLPMRGFDGELRVVPRPMPIRFYPDDGTTFEVNCWVHLIPKLKNDIPSLLGRDVLRFFRLTVDWPSRWATLVPRAWPPKEPPDPWG